MTLVIDLLPQMLLEVVIVTLAEKLEESENQDQVLLKLISHFQIVIIKLNLFLLFTIAPTITLTITLTSILLTVTSL